jgi:hypothetical protein
MKNTGYDLTARPARAFYGGDSEKEADMANEITIRHSSEADRLAVHRLAELDSQSALTGDLLLAFVDDELRAAVAVDSGDVVADPFYPTVELVELLRMSAGQPEQATGLGLRAFRHAAEAA